MGDSLGEVRVDEQSRDRLVVGMSVDDPVQELGADDAAVAPDRGNVALVGIPVVLVGTSDADVEARLVGDDLLCVERGTNVDFEDVADDGNLGRR